MFLETNQLDEGSPVILSTFAPIHLETYQVFNTFRVCVKRDVQTHDVRHLAVTRRVYSRRVYWINRGAILQFVSQRTARARPGC